MQVLHESELLLHGHLNSYNILVDNRWNCKLTDYGLSTFKDTSLEVNKDVVIDEEGRFEGKFSLHLFIHLTSQPRFFQREREPRVGKIG